MALPLPTRCLKCGAERSIQRRTLNYGTPRERSYLKCVECKWRMPETRKR